MTSGNRIKTIRGYLMQHGVQPTRAVRRLAVKVYKRGGRGALNACIAAGAFERATEITSPEVQRILTSDILRVKDAQHEARKARAPEPASVYGPIKQEPGKKGWMGRFVQKLLRKG